MANILDGKKISSQLKMHIQEKIETLSFIPGLAVILLGNDPASEIYVNNKCKACEEVGIFSSTFNLPVNTSETELIKLIDQLNQDNKIHGILVQLPLPKHINAEKIIETITPRKDVDGFHPYNLGKLAQKFPVLRPCTPYGIMQLLNAYDIKIKGKHAVVVGASNIVGRPMALEFLLAGATVTVCHRFTQNLEYHVRAADIIVLATGYMDVINTDWLNENQTLVDVGMHRLSNASLRGDVDFEKAKNKLAWITPVPGGVGPMTIVALLENTVSAAILTSS